MLPMGGQTTASSVLARQTPELPARSPGVVVGVRQPQPPGLTDLDAIGGGVRQPQPPGLTDLDAIGVPVRPSLIGSGTTAQGGVRSIPSLQMQPTMTNSLVRTPVTMEVHLPEKPTVIGPGPDGGSSMPQLSAVPPSGAVVSPDEMACLDAFDGLPSSDQARVFEDGHLGGYQFAQAVAHDLRNGFASSASKGVGWLLATFPSGSAELRDFCAAVRGVVGTHGGFAPSGAASRGDRSGRGFAPSGAAIATAVKGGTLPFFAAPRSLQVFTHPSDDTTLAPPVGYREDAATAVACLDDLARRRILYPDVDHLVRAILSSGLFPSGQTDRRILGTEAPESASPFEGLVLLRSAAEQAVARRNVVVTQRSAADEMNRLTDFIYRYLRAGLASRNASIRDAYTRIVLDVCRWVRSYGQASEVGGARPATARPAGAPLVASGPVLNDTDARAIFTHLSPGAQIAVLRGLAFRGDAYASSLANALAQGRVEVDGFPITTLLFAHVDRAYPARNDPRRILFAYSTGLAARSEGILVTPAGDPPPATPATTTPTPPIAPAEFLAAAGINADQWSQILARSPETAAQMWTEYQRRPSTFAQVSQLILQAADAVLRGLHQSATDQLAAQQAQYAHQQAMATAAVQQAQANANAAQQLLGLTAAQPTQQTVTAPIVTQPAPTTAQAPSEPMSTGTKVAIGGAAVAALGGLAYVATRPKRKSNSKQGRKQRRHKRSGRRAA